ncbi:MAG: PspC domain-containing protein [Chitinophagales bacterium]
MRKTININLGGVAFTIDENAFEALHAYLEALKRKFSNETERTEIMADIEGRMAEMLSQRIGDRKEVASLEDIEYIINVMGKPEDIAGEGEATGTEQKTSATTTNTTTTGPKEPIKKRLFRDPDDKRVAGVISGLCHYLGIDDPVWLRILAVVFIPLTSGAIIPIYILLMIIVPEADSAAEKLQMRGEPINIKTIEKEFRDAANRTGESVKGLVKDKTIFERLSSTFVTILKVMLKIMLAFVIFIGMVVLFALLAGIFGVSVAGNAIITKAPYMVVDNPSVITMIKVGFILFVGAPVLGAIYGAIRLIIGKRAEAPRIGWVFALLFVAGIVLLSIAGWKTARNYKMSATKAEEVAITTPVNGSLYVQIADENGKAVSPDEDDNLDFNIDFDGVFVNGDDISNMDIIPVGEPELQLIPSTDSAFHLFTVFTSRGTTRSEALHNITMVQYPVKQIDTVLNLPPYLQMPKGGKWRAQNVKLQLAIPANKKVKFANNLDRWVAIVKGNHAYDDTYFNNTVWTVDSNAVKCVAGENHYNQDKEEKKLRKEEEKNERLERKLEQMERKLERIKDDN